jgi:hypothetical protein
MAKSSRNKYAALENIEVETAESREEGIETKIVIKYRGTKIPLIQSRI